MLFLDLDGFKAVNDGLGHAAGDDLLAQVGLRLLVVTRAGDTVARLGGDEFAILLEGPRAEGDATAIADRVLASLGGPFVVQDVETHVGASIGIAEATGVHGTEELLRRADAAMYEAKRDGKGRYVAFDDGMAGESA